MIDIPGYKGQYYACADGRIFTVGSNKLPRGGYLKPWLIKSGYYVVMLYKPNKKPKKFLVHRLIANAFQVAGTGTEVNHIDGDKLNNVPSNLEYVTSKQNKQHAIRLGLYSNLGKNPARGEASGRTNLCNQDVLDIRALFLNGQYSYKFLAQKYNVTPNTIGHIVRRKTWTHI